MKTLLTLAAALSAAAQVPPDAVSLIAKIARNSKKNADAEKKSSAARSLIAWFDLEISPTCPDSVK